MAYVVENYSTVKDKAGNTVLTSKDPSKITTSSAYNSNAGAFVKPVNVQGLTYSNGTTVKPTSTAVTKTVGDNYVRNPSYKTDSSNGNVPTTNNTTPRTTTPSAGSGGGSDSGNYSYTGSTDDIVEKIKALLQEQQDKSKEYFKTLYDQQTAQNKEQWEKNRNQINVNYARGDRYLRNLYGDAVSGQGLSNRVRNNSNWQSNLATNRQNYVNNDATALASYNSNLANAANTFAQGYYNYVLPVYTNRQQNIDDLDYRKYIAGFNL